MTEYAFDIVLCAAVRVEADTLEDAKRILAEKLDCADCNAGAWDNGDPILFEASIINDGDKHPIPGINGPELFEIDDEDPDAEPDPTETEETET